MFAVPVRSDTNANDLPSGAHCGLMLRPESMYGSSSRRPMSRSKRAIRRLPKAKSVKFVSGPSSVTYAIVCPSGDQAGISWAYLSFVSWRSPVPSAFTTKRSEMPPFWPLKASCLPSGLKTGEVMPLRSTWIRRTALPFFGSNTTMSSPLATLATNTRYLLSGDHDAEELRYRKVS